MTYQTILTSKGTTTIPKAIRDSLGIKPGMLITFSEDLANGAVRITRGRTIQEMRAANQAAMKRAGTSEREYTSGDGTRAHVKHAFGSSSA